MKKIVILPSKLCQISVLTLRYLTLLFSFSYSTTLIAAPIDNGCFNNEWIAITAKHSSSCPRAYGWTESKLFSAHQVDGNPSLESYCQYKKLLGHNGNNTPPTELQKLIDKGLLKKNIQRNCVVVGGLASAIDHKAVLESQLKLQTGKSEIPNISKERYPVRLAIIDSLPTAELYPENNSTNSPHGASLTEIARFLLCEQTKEVCLAQITSQLALAYIAELREDEYHIFRDDFQGGYFGSLTDLSLAIQNETSAWKSGKQNKKLILNLSLGWNGDVWGGTTTNPIDYPAAVKSVFDSIVSARCHGALIIAAAGNKSKTETQDFQAMLPARWAKFPSPSKEDCLQYGIKLVPEERKNSKNESILDSLVYGVSGIDALGNPLANSRKNSNATITAFGDHAALQNTTATNTEVLTGSSVSTVVVSSIASLVWGYRPELSATELMSLVYDAGEPLKFNADFQPPTPRPLVAKRASMCSALLKACKDNSCPAPNHCNWQKQMGDLTGTGLMNSPATANYNLNSFSACKTSQSDCNAIENGSIAISPWTTPQPDSDACPNCMVSLQSHTMIMQTNASYGGSITDPKLLIGEALFDLPPFSPGDKIMITDLPNSIDSNNLFFSYMVNDSFREWVPILVSE